MDWVQGLVTVAGAGEPTMKAGLAIHMYVRSRSRSVALSSYHCYTNDAHLPCVIETPLGPCVCERAGMRPMPRWWTVPCRTRTETCSSCHSWGE